VYEEPEGRVRDACHEASDDDGIVGPGILDHEAQKMWLTSFERGSQNVFRGASVFLSGEAVGPTWWIVKISRFLAQRILGVLTTRQIISRA
jgi:hypothetical protein